MLRTVTELVDLVNDHVPEPRASLHLIRNDEDHARPIEAILFRMEERGLTRRDLEPLIGGRARVSEALNRKCPLALAMIRRLRAGLGLSADLLVGEDRARSRRCALDGS